MSKFQYLSSPEKYDNWTRLTESDGEWLEFYDEWWTNGGARVADVQQFHVAQRLVREILVIAEDVSFNKSLYDDIATISIRFRDGVIIDPGGDLGLDASQLRAFLLYRMAQQIPSFITVDSETPDTYMIDERGIFVLPMADIMFKGGLFPPRNRELERPWAFVDTLNDSSTRKGPPSGAAREDIAFSVILAHDRQYGYQRWGDSWQEHNEAGRFKTKAKLQVYVDKVQKMYARH